MTADREVRFERQALGCCSVCNPVALADFETDTLVARAPSGKTLVALCHRCAMAFYVAAVSETKTPTVELHPEILALVRELRDHIVRGKR